jgi:repressor LexA
MTKPGLTDRQKAVLQYIEDQIVDRGHPPTIREIGARFGISSTNGVRTHLTALLKKGYIKKQDMISRGIELTRELAANIGRVPLVGSVPAGNPIDAVENVEGEIALDLSFMPSGETFSLRVTGHSMKNAGILNGDVVVVKKQQSADAGEIVVAIVDGEATVKRYYPQARRIKLQPENEAFAPIYVDPKRQDFRIAGKVVGLLRRIS